MKSLINRGIMLLIIVLLLLPGAVSAKEKKGLLVYYSIYGSTIETAYWIKAIIGHEHQLDVKSLPQVISVKPYDYVIIGSVTRWEKPHDEIYEFVEKFKDQLAEKQVCYYLNCGDTDETMVLNAPGQEAHLIAGRNYLMDIINTYSDIKPVVIGGFGGRQVMPTMGLKDTFWIWVVGKLAKEGAAWEGLDIWESLVPERVEVFANDIRVKVLGLEPRENVEQFRGYWQSAQPAKIGDPTKKKFKPKPFFEWQDKDDILFVRLKKKGGLQDGIEALNTWSRETGVTLKEQVKTSYNVYYHALKTYDGQEHTLHVVASTLPEDPGYIHFSFRCYEEQAKRVGVLDDMKKAKAIISPGESILKE